MHIQGYDIELELISTKEILAFEMVFITDDRKSETDRIINQIKKRIEIEAKNRPVRIVAIVGRRYDLGSTET